jgi:hypothetical protein
LASPSSFLAFLGGWENDRFPGRAAEAAPPTTRSPRRETLSFRPCQDLSWRLSWGFQRCPSIGLGARRPLLLGFASACASVPPRFGLSLPGDRSRSAFVVSHHLDGFLRRASCGFVAPRSRSWGSPRFWFLRDSFSLRGRGLFGFGQRFLPRRITLRSLSTFAAVRRVSTVLPDSCPPAVHLPKKARLQGFSPRSGSRSPSGLSTSGSVQLPWVSSLFVGSHFRASPFASRGR